MGVGTYGTSLYLLLKFFCEPKTALKKKSIHFRKQDAKTRFRCRLCELIVVGVGRGGGPARVPEERTCGCFLHVAGALEGVLCGR